MKRIISLILTILMLGTTLSGCGLSHFRFNEEGTTGAVVDGGAMADGTITMGQWLMLINNAFGMETYTEVEPYFSNVTAASPYFEAVQIATEWEVVDVNETLDVNKKLTWEEALVTLVNVGEFIDIASAKQDKINYAIANFESDVSSDLSKEIKYENAVVLLATAQEKWANKTYEKNIEEATYNEDLVNLVENVKTDYEIKGNQVTISSDLVGELNEGDIYVIQSKENPLEYTYCKAESVTTKDGFTYITNSTERIPLEEVFQDLKLQGQIVPTAENAIIRDAYGNIIACPDDYAQVLAKEDPKFAVMGFSQVKETEIKVGDYAVTFDIGNSKKNGLNFKIGVEKEKKGFKVGNTFSINKLKVVEDVDIGWFKINSAMLRLDYEIEDNFYVGYEKEIPEDDKDKEQITLAEIYEVTGVFVSECKLKVLKENNGANNMENEEIVRIFSIDIYSIGIAKITLDVNFKIAVDGTISVIVTHSGSVGMEYKKGKARFIKDNDKDVDVELKAQAEFTVGVGPALYALGFDDPIFALEAAMGAGVSVALKMHLVDEANHLIEEYSFDDNCAEDCMPMASMRIVATPETLEKVARQQGRYYKSESVESVPLHMGICLDATVYGILTLGITDDCYARDWIGKKAETSIEIFGEDNAKVINYHVDNWEWSKAKLKFYPISDDYDPCTLKFTPFDEEEETTTEEPTTEEPTTEQPTASVEPNEPIGNNSYDVKYGEVLFLTEFSASLKVGGKYSVMVQQLPYGYSLSDIVFVSEDPSIAKVNAAGIVEGIKPGNVNILAKTSDGKYAMAIKISVQEDQTIDFEGIEV